MRSARRREGREHCEYEGRPLKVWERSKKHTLGIKVVKCSWSVERQGARAGKAGCHRRGSRSQILKGHPEQIQDNSGNPWSFKLGSKVQMIEDDLWLLQMGWRGHPVEAGWW